MALTANDINKMLEDYIETDEGRGIVNEYVRDSIEDGKDKAGKEYARFNPIYMQGLGDDYLYEARLLAEKEGVPDSVLNAFDAFYVESPYLEEDDLDDKEFPMLRFVSDVSIVDESLLSRESLAELDRSGNPVAGKRTGDGIDNIIQLFNTGYHANGAVFGRWEHSASNETEDVWSLRARDGLHFMQDAAKEFETCKTPEKDSRLRIHGIFRIYIRLSSDWY